MNSGAWLYCREKGVLVLAVSVAVVKAEEYAGLDTDYSGLYYIVAGDCSGREWRLWSFETWEDANKKLRDFAQAKCGLI